jgi:hypothetical protein
LNAGQVDVKQNHLMNIVQFVTRDNQRRVGWVENDQIRILKEVHTTYDLFFRSLREQCSVKELTVRLTSDQCESYDELLREKRVRVPLDHPDPYHTWITGTGLTHLGSAASRDAMHQKAAAGKAADATDSMKMFSMGIENGKMTGAKPGVQPEWFFKGNGLSAVHPEQPLHCPPYAMDGGEEPELAGLYIIDPHGVARRIGFALGNEFSDHKMERINYLYLAHSKLRQCSYGPELLLDELPLSVSGISRIRRQQHVLWEKEFFTGEENMSHHFANLEYHQFKYELFRQPGDVHVHYLGTSVLSFSDHVETKSGDIFEIESPLFGRPLRNPLIAE